MKIFAILLLVLAGVHSAFAESEITSPEQAKQIGITLGRWIQRRTWDDVPPIVAAAPASDIEGETFHHVKKPTADDKGCFEFKRLATYLHEAEWAKVNIARPELNLIRLLGQPEEIDPTPLPYVVSSVTWHYPVKSYEIARSPDDPTVTHKVYGELVVTWNPDDKDRWETHFTLEFQPYGEPKARVIIPSGQ